MVSKWFFIHLMATYLPVLMLWAFNTSEKVPSPFLEIKRYSKLKVRFILNNHEAGKVN